MSEGRSLAAFGVTSDYGENVGKWKLAGEQRDFVRILRSRQEAGGSSCWRQKGFKTLSFEYLTLKFLETYQLLPKQE
ncbi:hypothetical protein PQG02_35560 (plasmid) [Nostoc sp. UHCC 0926]|uniref:hypothetical protein n=1 Tax=Nostoc sp. UHCC 0926 TaxID=3025190 RepID=UPI0023604447|nr:hypothetical protein [Nostoc sp. UHCC 0926]WDD37070.1 hypothetical protein PQG02_35560 [Nostoc sp. UHCC 0926]